MNVRFGKCASCGAEYKVPDSFQHDMARCKECGGVAHFGPAQSPDGPPKFPAAAKAAQPETPKPQAPKSAPRPAAKPMPARKVTPKPAAPKQAQEQTRKPAPKAPARPAPRSAAKPAVPAPKAAAAGGESMLDRLKAERRAAAEGKQPAAAKPAAGKSAGARTAARTAGKAAGAATTARAAGGRRGATRRRGKGGDEDEEPEGRSRRGARAKKEKSSMPMLLGFGGIIVVAAGAYFGKDLLFSDATDEAASGEVSAKEPTTDTPKPDDLVAATTPESTDAPDDATPEDEGTDAFGDVADLDPAAEKATTKRKTIAMQDPADTDLSVYSFGPPFDTSDEEWAEMNELMATWMDPWAGAAGSRARNALVEKDVKAFPVILNAMTKLDLGTEEGRRSGDLCQKELEHLLSGRNFGWAYPDPNAEDKALEENRCHVYNKKVVDKYCKQWQSVVDQGIEYFIKFAKLDEEGSDERNARAADLRRQFGSGVTTNDGGLDAPPGDDFDLDVD